MRSTTARRFAAFFGIDLLQTPVPDTTTLFIFRRLRETYVDHDSGAVHCTAANVADISATAHLLNDNDKQVFADAGYLGAEKREEHGNREIDWTIAAKRSQVKAMADGTLNDLMRAFERRKAYIRSRVEHPFHVVKNLFSHKMVRHKGVEKNTAQWQVMFALANLYLLRKPLLAQ